ncbi:hypothetical protein Tco_0818399 [Tanacetum coccineum]
MTPMALSDSKVNNNKSCSKTCLTNYETLKKQYDDLIFKLHETEFKASTYKRGLATVEDQLVTFRKNEILFSEEVAVLKREVGYKNYEISVLKTEFEKVNQEKEGIEFNIEKFDSASKSLDKLLEKETNKKELFTHKEEMAPMALLDSKVNNDKSCSKTCLTNYETIKKQYDDLIFKLHETEFKAATYKRGLTTVEDQLVTFRKNEILFSEEIAVLKREVGCKNYEISMLKTEFEKVKQEKEGIEFKIKKFDSASKSLDKLLESQITDKSKKGLGYSAVPLPHTLIYNRPNKLNLSYSGLDEFKEPELKGYGPENSKQESNVVCETKSDNSKENSDKSLVKEQVSQDKSSFVEGYGPNTSKSVSEVEPNKVRKNDDASIIKD